MVTSLIKPNILNSAINPYTDKVNIDDRLGIRWSANHARYSAVVQVIKVAGKTVTVKIVDKNPKAYSLGHVLKSNISKPTKDNCLFHLDGKSAYSTEKGIENFNNHELKMEELASKAINQYWKERIDKAEEEQKQQGVYVESTTYQITGNGLEKVKDNYRISV